MALYDDAAGVDREDSTKLQETDKLGDGVGYDNVGRGTEEHEEQPILSVDFRGEGSSDSSRRPRPRQLSRKRHWKNLIVLSLGFLFTFSAYNALANLQSSLNYSSGLGVASLCAIQIGVLISSLLAPLVISILHVKWTLVVCSLFYALYSASNVYPAVFTLIPAGAFLGLAAAPFWTAAGTYITTSAILMADITDGIPEIIINRFNGVFYCIFQSAQVWGNLISSLVLGNRSSDANMDHCGRHSCGTGQSFGNITAGSKMADREELVLISIYVAVGLLSSCTMVFLLDALPKSSNQETRAWRAHLSDHLVATLQLIKSPYLVLLIPLMVYSGAEQAYISADFTKAFVTCTHGAGKVGYVMIGYGVADSIASAIFGQLEKYTGRMFIFLFGGSMHMALLVIFEIWNVESSTLWELLLMAVGWGIGDAVWQTQISSILGVLFPEAQEPAFANFRLYQAIGFAILYALNIPPAICVFHRLYGLMSLLTFSLVCYIGMEYLLRRH